MIGLMLHTVKWREARSCAFSAKLIWTLLGLSHLHPSALFGQGNLKPIVAALLVISGLLAAACGGAVFLAAFWDVVSSLSVSVVGEAPWYRVHPGVGG